MDVTIAYLNGELNEKVYMELSDQLLETLITIKDDPKFDNEIRKRSQEWYEQLQGEKSKVCLLKKSLYGLRQSGREWYKKLDLESQNLGLSRTKSDPCVYTATKDGKTIIIAVYVDDLIMISSCEKWIENMKVKLMNTFRMKDLGKINYCLGIEFKQSEDKHCIMMSQQRYIDNALKRFGMQDCNTISSPLDANAKLNTGNQQNNEKLPYQNLIGTLMYLAISTRPDIAYTVSMLSQFNNCYTQEHWLAAKRVLRYLKGTRNNGLIFQRTNDSITGYADADWGGSIIDRRSYTGYAFIMSGASVSWESKKQRTVQ